MALFETTALHAFIVSLLNIYRIPSAFITHNNNNKKFPIFMVHGKFVTSNRVIVWLQTTKTCSERDQWKQIHYTEHICSIFSDALKQLVTVIHYSLEMVVCSRTASRLSSYIKEINCNDEMLMMASVLSLIFVCLC